MEYNEVMALAETAMACNDGPLMDQALAALVKAMGERTGDSLSEDGIGNDAEWEYLSEAFDRLFSEARRRDSEQLAALRSFLAWLDA